MAHNRQRHIQVYIEKLMGFSPIVGILGHRQSGKTTLMNEVAKTYVTMDQRSSLQAAEADPDGFIAKMPGLANGIDECQFAPDLFPASHMVRLVDCLAFVSYATPACVRKSYQPNWKPSLIVTCVKSFRQR